MADTDNHYRDRFERLEPDSESVEETPTTTSEAEESLKLRVPPDDGVTRRW